MNGVVVGLVILPPVHAAAVCIILRDYAADITNEILILLQLSSVRRQRIYIYMRALIGKQESFDECLFITRRFSISNTCSASSSQPPRTPALRVTEARPTGYQI